MLPLLIFTLMMHCFKRYLFLALSVLLLCRCSSAPVQTSWPGFEHGMGIGGWLTNYKRFNVLPDDRRMVLTTGDYEHFETYITKKDVANIAFMGMDHVRVGFDQIVLEPQPYAYCERTFRLLDSFSDWCSEYGLNLVFNLHKAVGNYCDIQEETSLLDDESLQQRFIALWLEIERRFHAKPDIVFELLNEVRDVPAEPWNRLAVRTIAALREVNPSRRIVIGPVRWNSPSALKDLVVLDDPNVIYTFHMYAPFEFTHQQGVLQANPLFYNRKMPYPCDDIERYRDYKRVAENEADPYPDRLAVDKEFLRKELQPVFDFMDKHPDKIVWAGEFGTIRHARMEWREAWMRDVISLYREHGIPYCVWNYLSTPNDGNRFSLVDDDTRKILSPALLKIIQGKGPRD